MLMNVLRFIVWGEPPNCPDHGIRVHCNCKAPVTWIVPYTLPKVWVTSDKYGRNVFVAGVTRPPSPAAGQRLFPNGLIYQS